MRCAAVHRWRGSVERVPVAPGCGRPQHWQRAVYVQKRMCTPIATHATDTHGDSRSPMRAHFQNVPRKLKQDRREQHGGETTERKSVHCRCRRPRRPPPRPPSTRLSEMCIEPGFMRIEPCWCVCVHVGAETDHEQQHRQQGLKIEEGGLSDQTAGGEEAETRSPIKQRRGMRR